MSRLAASRPSRAMGEGAERGQSLVEMAMIFPFLMLLVMGAIEFGFIFTHSLAMEYATREGARVGSSLANGGGSLGCGAGQSPNRGTVEPRVVAAVERVLESSGSPIDINEVLEVRIFKAGTSGQELGPVNVWQYDPGNGPVVDGLPLDFREISHGWDACSRVNTQPADSMGVGVRYRYVLQTPFLSLTGISSLTWYDKTVMALNPTGN